MSNSSLPWEVIPNHTIWTGEISTALLKERKKIRVSFEFHRRVSSINTASYLISFKVGWFKI